MQTNKAQQLAQQQAHLMEQTESIIIYLGDTLAERKEAIARIKEAMADAILLNVENEIEDVNKESMKVYSGVYREANTIQSYLKAL